MRSARDALEEQGARVCDGSDWLGKVVYRDAMYFHVVATATVVDMYSDAVIKAQKDSSEMGDFLTGPDKSEATKLVDELSSADATPMDPDPDLEPDPNPTTWYHGTYGLYQSV